MVEKRQQQTTGRSPDRPEAREKRQSVSIVPYETAYRDDFRRLNVEWLDKYFRVEKSDERVLSDPESQIIERGGFICFARIGSDNVGTAALIAVGAGRYELTKMSVTEAYQGQGIGRKLAEAAIRQFESTGGRELYLESNSCLTPALTLYESLGFVHRPVPDAPGYERADVYMVYRPQGH